MLGFEVFPSFDVNIKNVAFSLIEFCNFVLFNLSSNVFSVENSSSTANFVMLSPDREDGLFATSTPFISFGTSISVFIESTLYTTFKFPIFIIGLFLYKI